MSRFIVILFMLVSYLEASELSYQTMLFNGNCVTCHDKTDSISAPSIRHIQTVYKNAFPIEKDFVNYMANWVIHPNPSTTLMNDAIIKYELMPELGFDLDTLEHISRYIYRIN